MSLKPIALPLMRAVGDLSWLSVQIMTTELMMVDAVHLRAVIQNLNKHLSRIEELLPDSPKAT